MTAITTREALPRALWKADREAHPHIPGFGETWETEPCQDSYKRIVDALLASGAVIDAANLADDEALVRAAAEAICRTIVADNVIGNTHTVWTDWRPEALGALRALATALTERGERDG
ncbi:MAG TPA: hypothetical protein VF049_21355 [Nocardioidaceae bacterium]